MAEQPQYGYPTPGVQSVTPNEVMKNAFFMSDEEWENVRGKGDFDYVVIGSSYCALGFINRVIKNNPNAKILVLERGQYFHPEHFQNLPPAYMFSLHSSAETFPWRITKATHEGKYIKWQHGSNNFFGGRSIFWSAWCPEPTNSEMEEWPEPVKKTVRKYFPEAENLMGVTPADEIFDQGHTKGQAIFGTLQMTLQVMFANTQKNIKSVTRVIPAPLAVGSKQYRYEDFAKNSVPGRMLALVMEKRVFTKTAPLNIHIECTVEKIEHDGKKATTLKTNKGDLALGNAKLILAMGALPPTTLMLNSFSKVEFPLLANIGERFTSHFISAIIARVPRKKFPNANNFGDLEIAAMYVAGVDKKSRLQYHIQLSAVASDRPTESIPDTIRHLPDVVAAPSYEQLSTSRKHIVFVCACLGQLDHNNSDNWFRLNEYDDITCNTTLQVLANDEDNELWDVMDDSTFKILEEELIPGGENLEYWHPNGDSGSWESSRPTTEMIRVPGLVHEASTMWIGDDDDKKAPVGLDYRPRGVENVYITGGSLWPTGASWNPTPTMVALATHLADNLEPPKSS